jgi:acyl-CoA reductase-like NAD-dependent aldehyde dehydrogenase
MNQSPTHESGHAPGSGARGDKATHRSPGAPDGARPVDRARTAPALDVVPAATADEVAAAVSLARAAHDHWRHRPVAERAECLKKAAKTMLRRRGEIIELARREMGKVDVEGLFNEALGPLDTVSGWTRVVARATRRRPVRLNPLSFPKKESFVDYVPRGVVGVIAPWNYPAAGLYRSIFPALLTGNGVVLKPSEYSPRTSAWLASCLASELPEGLLGVVHGDGKVGAQLLDSGIDACVFTGSSSTGRLVRVRCAERGIPASIEMGGKDPAIVLADCDLERTVAGITHWALSNAGQACGAIELVYVDRGVADEFVNRLRRAWSKLRVADATGAGDFPEVAPLANDRQLETVVRHVEDARAKGAKVVCGGAKTGQGRGYLPTVLDHCDERMLVVEEETFGPVLAIVRVEGAAEAVRRTNRGRYGLGASIWTRDIARGERLAERLDVGVVTINNHAFSGAIPGLPWSGTRATGFGVANGPESLATFVRPRATLVDRSTAPEPFWMPYDATLWELGEILAGAQIFDVARAWRLPIAMRKRLATVRRFFS